MRFAAGGQKIFSPVFPPARFFAFYYIGNGFSCQQNAPPARKKIFAPVFRFFALVSTLPAPFFVFVSFSETEGEKTGIFREKVFAYPGKSVDNGRKISYNNDTEFCRCRLAVWRQLPKLIPASSTLVTCSKKDAFLTEAFFFGVKRLLARVEGGAASGSEHFARSESFSATLHGKTNSTVCCLAGRAAKGETLVTCSKKDAFLTEAFFFGVKRLFLSLAPLCKGSWLPYGRLRDWPFRFPNFLSPPSLRDTSPLSKRGGMRTGHDTSPYHKGR